MTCLDIVPPDKKRREQMLDQVQMFLEALEDDDAVAFSAVVHFRGRKYATFGNSSSEKSKHEISGELLEMAVRRLD